VHAKGHSADEGNDRADDLAEWGKGTGPYCKLRDGNGEGDSRYGAFRTRWRRRRHPTRPVWLARVARGLAGTIAVLVALSMLTHVTAAPPSMLSPVINRTMGGNGVALVAPTVAAGIATARALFAAGEPDGADTVSADVAVDVPTAASS
jgi:hypothetical protein